MHTCLKQAFTNGYTYWPQIIGTFVGLGTRSSIEFGNIVQSKRQLRNVRMRYKLSIPNCLTMIAKVIFKDENLFHEG